MKNSLASLVLFGFSFYATSAAAQTCGNGSSSAFRWPLDGWETNCNGYWGTCNKPYHLGSDSAPGSEVVGTPVYAACSGKVKEAQFHNGYGGTVIIECLAGDACVTVINGHMFPEPYTYNDVLYSGLQVSAGENVEIGDLIGYIADKDTHRNGNWAPHVHIGISVGAYSSGANCEDGWTYAGYASNVCVKEEWYDPDVFIPAHMTVTSTDIETALDAREAAGFPVLNSHSGNMDGNTPLNVLGTRYGNLDTWFGTDPDDIVYDDGVPNDAYVQYYTGGAQDGAIIVHPDSGMAVELYGVPYKVWTGESTSYTVTDNCGVSWFLDGYGPHSEFGLPITGKYYVPENDRWRIDFQRGYMSWDTNTQTMYLNCYTYATPGWTTFTGMGWDDSISAAVAQAYERNGAKSIVGYAFDDNNGGTTVHIWDGEVIQNFANGEIDENAIIVNLDALSESLPLENTASVIRGGFWDYYGSNDGPTYFGSPLGDEMDTVTVNGELIGYDPVCDDNADGENDLSEREGCIAQYCGTSDDYSSMQRFEEVTLCYNSWDMYVECDPNSNNWVCHYIGSSSVNHEGDLWVYNSTIYWIDGGETHAIGSEDLFEACGFDWSEPYPVTEEIFTELPEGDMVDDPTDCGAVVDGTLVDQFGTVYEYWETDNSWHGYSSSLAFEACQNDWGDVGTMVEGVFDTIPVGDVLGTSFDCGVTYTGMLVHWNGTVYRITDTGLKRGFTSSDVFTACGYDWDLVTYLTNEEYPVVTTLGDGSAISSTSDCSNVEGDLVHWEWTSTIYYLTGTGYKRGVTSVEAFNSCGFDWNQVRYVTNANGAVVWTLGDAANITGSGDCP